jgi:hypothetical protein
MRWAVRGMVSWVAAGAMRGMVSWAIRGTVSWVAAGAMRGVMSRMARWALHGALHGGGCVANVRGGGHGIVRGRGGAGHNDEEEEEEYHETHCVVVCAYCNLDRETKTRPAPSAQKNSLRCRWPLFPSMPSEVIKEGSDVWIPSAETVWEEGSVLAVSGNLVTIKASKGNVVQVDTKTTPCYLRCVRACVLLPVLTPIPPATPLLPPT